MRYSLRGRDVIVTVEGAETHLDVALACLREARDRLIQATMFNSRGSRAVERVRHALKSAEGVERHEVRMRREKRRKVA